MKTNPELVEIEKVNIPGSNEYQVAVVLAALAGFTPRDLLMMMYEGYGGGEFYLGFRQQTVQETLYGESGSLPLDKPDFKVDREYDGRPFDAVPTDTYIVKWGSRVKRADVEKLPQAIERFRSSASLEGDDPYKQVREALKENRNRPFLERLGENIELLSRLCGETEAVYRM